MSIIELIERRANRAHAEAHGLTLIEDLSPAEQKAILDDMEQKARYVRTAAGVRRFKRPIGAIILPRGLGSLDRIRIKDPVFKGFDLVEDRKGNLYDVGKDDSTGKYVALKHNSWDDQIKPADSLDDALAALNEKLGGGTNSDREEGEKPAPKAKTPEPKKAPSKAPEPKDETPKESPAAAKAREDALGIRNAMTATNGRIDGHEKDQSALLEKGTTKAERDAMRRHSELITEIEDQTRAAKTLKRNQATPQDVKDMMDLVIESEKGRKDRATKARDTAMKYAPKPKTSAPEKTAPSPAVLKELQFATANANNQSPTFDVNDSLEKHQAALSRLQRAMKDAPDDEGATKAEARLKRNIADLEAKKSEAARQLQETVDRNKDRRKAEATTGSVGAPGSKERDAFIESRPKLKGVSDYHKPKLRDLSEKNFQAYVDAVEGGKSPDSIGAIMSRVDPGASWNPTTEKWSGQGSKGRPTSPTPTGDTSASDAADRATRDAVDKMKAEERSKGRTNPYTSSLAPYQRDQVNALTPGEYAKYMNARDAGETHRSAHSTAKGEGAPSKPKTREAELEESRETMKMHETANYARRPFTRAENDFTGTANMIDNGKLKTKRQAENAIKNLEKNIAKREEMMADKTRLDELLARDVEARQRHLRNDKARLKKVRAKVSAMPADKEPAPYTPPSQRPDPDAPGGPVVVTTRDTTPERAAQDRETAPKMSTAEKRTHDGTIKAYDKAQTAARNLSQGPDVETNLRRYTAARDGLDRAIREHETIRKTGYGSSPETERRYADSRSLRDTLDARLKGFREQRAQEQADLKREQEEERQRAREAQDVADRARDEQTLERRRAREGQDAISQKYGNERQMIASNDDHLKSIVEAGRAGNAESLRAETQERIAEIQRRLATDDRTLGGYGLGKGGDEADQNGAQIRDRLTGQLGSFQQALAIMDRVGRNQEIAQEQEASRNRQPAAVPQNFDSQRRIVERKRDALNDELRNFEKTGHTQAWLNKVATVERYYAIQKKFQDHRAEVEALDPSTGGMSADFTKTQMLKDLDHRIRMIQRDIDRSKASDRAKERARAKANTPTAAERQAERQDRRQAAGEPEPRQATGEALGTRLPSVDSTLAVAKTQMAKARRARSERGAQDAIQALNNTERDLRRDLTRSGDRMTSEQRADIQRALTAITEARRKAEEQTPVSRRTTLRPSDIPALNEQNSQSRDYREVARNRATAEALGVFDSLPTSIPDGQRYGDQELDRAALANMEDAPSVPALNRAIRTLEEQEDTTVDDEIRVLKEARDYLKESADQERAEFEAANTSLFGDDFSIPERTAPAPVETDDYRMRHQVPTLQDVENDEAAGLADLTNLFPSDVYDKPKNYDAQFPETIQQMRKARGNPDAMVTIYRGVPAGVTDINDGDWVSLSRGYAQTHIDSNVEGGHIISAQVPARTIVSEANSLEEWGYRGGKPAGQSTRPQTAVERAQAELDAYDERARNAPRPDRGMESMRFHQTERQANRRGERDLNDAMRQVRERNKLEADVRDAKRQERIDATPKTPVDPSIIKGSEAVLVYNKNTKRAEWLPVKRVSKASVTTQGSGGWGGDDIRYPHSAVVGVRKEGGVEIIGRRDGGTQAPAGQAEDRSGGALDILKRARSTNDRDALRELQREVYNMEGGDNDAHRVRGEIMGKIQEIINGTYPNFKDRPVHTETGISKAEAASRYANTPSYDISEAPVGRAVHIGGGQWVHRCSVCGKPFVSNGTIVYDQTRMAHEASHGGQVAGYNVGILS